MNKLLNGLVLDRGSIPLRSIIQVCRKTPSFSYGDIRHVHRSKGKKVKWNNAKRYQIQNLSEQGTAKFNQSDTWML